MSSCPRIGCFTKKEYCSPTWLRTIFTACNDNLHHRTSGTLTGFGNSIWWKLVLKWVEMWTFKISMVPLVDDVYSVFLKQSLISLSWGSKPYSYFSTAAGHALFSNIYRYAMDFRPPLILFWILFVNILLCKEKNVLSSSYYTSGLDLPECC